jgi:RNA polymerase sigma-70 factor (ECF subfamily)
LILRDVLRWSAAETAEALDLTATAVNSGLRRARSRLASAPLSTPETTALADRSVLDAYVTAFQQGDLDTLVGLLKDDVILEMPPVALWYRGVNDYRSFMSRIYALRGSLWRAVPVAANGQPAFAAYSRGADGGFRAHSLQVLTIEDGLISHNVVFADSRLFGYFDLPDRLPA